MKKQGIRKILATLLVASFCATVLYGCGKNEKSEASNVGEKTGDIEISNITKEDKENYYQCTFDGIQHEFIVVPPEVTEGSPLVLMLHGYGNNAERMYSDTMFHETAVARGYTVVYVTGAVDPNDKTAGLGWNVNIRTKEGGNRDVEFLKAMVTYLQEEYKTDQARTYAVGFSNGAFMTHRLATQASDTFAAVVSVSGMMPEAVWNAKPEEENDASDEHKEQDNRVGVFQITGLSDDVIPKKSDGSAASSPNPAIEDVMDYYVALDGLALTEDITLGNKDRVNLRKYTGEATSRQVWDMTIKEGHHSWPSEQLLGININEMICDFLDTQK